MDDVAHKFGRILIIVLSFLHSSCLCYFPATTSPANPAINMQFSKVFYVLFPLAVIAAPLQTFKVPTMDANTIAPEVPAIERRAPAEDTCTE
ncbi:hypothetical protein Cob_v009832 [Colletotrichum orbiculare MAFF 240422]|uniref:Uncharacterized protein n=1 Tax=Colletotrichum orbiculare (strain 104-T / ATCC 96160 / CBS 514.97 / LARS 414 / MAFF 240422) TaxID=1213857 RepID=A0A484FHL6_COLOR|nr:hypothetical protein Cob_v009832 [Colletotrichum orbiculare MAFF 240422]